MLDLVFGRAKRSTELLPDARSYERGEGRPGQSAARRMEAFNMGTATYFEVGYSLTDGSGGTVRS